METTLFLAAWLFTITHLDTLFVIGAFCADTDYGFWEVLIGHYIGFCLGLAAAIVGAVLAAELLHEWTFLLGIVPIGLGVWGLVRQPPETTIEKSPAVSGAGGRIGVVTAAGIGLSGENIAVFVPFFADLTLVELALITTCYMIGAGVIFLVAFGIVSRVVVDGVPDRLDRWLVPAVLVLVGGYVVATGVIAL